VVPTADAVPRLRGLFPSNPRLDLYLSTLGDLRGSGAPFALALGKDPQTGVDRGSVQFATGSYVFPAISDGPQWLVRIDHNASETHRLSWRCVADSRSNSPASACNGVTFPGFSLDQNYQNKNFLFSDSYTFGPSYTNEFRFSYARLDADECDISPQSVPLAHTLPLHQYHQYIATPGASQISQPRHPNNLLFQETQTKLSGHHAFRYGVEFMQQIATQDPPGAKLGTISYRDSLSFGYSAFANFLDDFSGPSAVAFRRGCFPPRDLSPDLFLSRQLEGNSGASAYSWLAL
jgi:hypothetical protein